VEDGAAGEPQTDKMEDTGSSVPSERCAQISVMMTSLKCQTGERRRRMELFVRILE